MLSWVKSGFYLLLKNSMGKGISTVGIGLDLDRREKFLCTLLDKSLPLLHILDILEKDALQVLDLARF